MKDVNVEYGTYSFSGLAVTRHSKEVFIEMNKGRTFAGKTDEETEPILSEIYDQAKKKVDEANKSAKKATTIIEPEIVNETIPVQTEGKESGVLGTSAGKKPSTKNR